MLNFKVQCIRDGTTYSLSPRKGGSVLLVNTRVNFHYKSIPDDKPNAEGSVKFATTWILAAIRNYHFLSFEEAYATVKEKLEALNNKSFKTRKRNRHTAYEEEERSFMHPLPPAPYELATWSTAKIHNDYTITDGLNRYSVPFDLIGETVDIRTTRDTVEVFFRGGRVASHVRLKKAQRDAVMVPGHMPEAHRRYLSYNQRRFPLMGLSRQVPLFPQ